MKALERQKDVNPDVIFSGFKPCRLDGKFFTQYSIYIYEYLTFNKLMKNILFIFFFTFFIFKKIEIFRGLSNVRTQPQPENWADSSILHDEE